MPNDMAFEPVTRSLITSKTAVTGAADLVQAEEHGVINLRLSGDAAMLAASQVLGVDIPLVANSFSTNGSVTVFWTGPDEWLVQVSDSAVARLHAELEKALSDHHMAATIVSDHSVAMELSGTAARKILEKGCPLDLHPRAFKVGHCAQSHFLQAVILVARLDQDRYLLRVRRSMSEYLWDVLADAIAKG